MGKIRILAALLACGTFAAVSHSQSFLPQPKPAPPVSERAAAPAPAPAPRLQAVADNRLLMDGLCQPNFQGLGKRLAEKPADADTWTIARGQALILAETGNLLMMRPPKGKSAQEAWLAAAMDLRSQSAKLSHAAETKDYPASTAALAGVANSCNRCHENVGEKTRVVPFEAR
jgi:hypothetical protein